MRLTPSDLEVVRADRGTYYVAESLYAELVFNTDNMNAYINNTADKPYVFNEHLTGIGLNDFMFQAARYSDSTFEIDPALLAEISVYYFVLGAALDKYYDSKQESPASLMKVVKRETKKIEENKTLEKLAAYNGALAKSIEARGVNLAQPEY